jgi:alginate O-acetyltransferase complex protein AlgJ
MRKFLFKFTLFLLPFFLAICLELFILPIDFFTIRVWESLVVKKFKNILPGPFYPNMETTKIEEGDLAAHTRFAIKKKVRWMTDRYGYRKQDTDLQKHKMVIIGESNIAGSSLTQEEILSEVLEDQLKVSVYPYAPVGRINSFLKNKRFIENSPDIVIFARIERELLDLPSLKPIRENKLSSKFKKQIQKNRMIQSLTIQLDRVSKMIMLHHFRANLRRSISTPKHFGSEHISSQYGPIFFVQGRSANEDVSKEKLDKAIQIIKSYNDAVKSRGIRFIFLPIPNKENIYFESLQTPRPVFLEQLISGLKSHGIETIDTQKAFEEAFQKNQVLLYHTDDTHWNGNAVRIAADLLTKVIEERERILPHS